MKVIPLTVFDNVIINNIETVSISLINVIFIPFFVLS